ncbi:phosphate ABC transporter substrate-binding protein PstS [Micromonospora sediminicola]|uniref:phosphate ABC transporter substrate-binding protein PstS n=1 Tax=Micromonospora sediminicola TaxID=946078 RepID=UPI0037A8B856
MRGSRRGAFAGLLSVLSVIAACGPAPTLEPTPGVACARGTLNGQGSSAQANAVQVWSTAFQRACPGTTINYEPSGSGAGITSFIAGVADFAGTDSPLSPDELEQARTRCVGAAPLALPMAVGPVAVTYHLPGNPPLRLTPGTVAAIFSGAVRRWDDPAIRADNPGTALPSIGITPVHRADSSGTTEAFTTFLAETASGRWPYGASRKWPLPGGVGVSGSKRVPDAVEEKQGRIGYLELSYLRGRDLPAAAVRNGAGEFVAPSSRATVKSVGALGPDLRLSLERATRAPGAYPLALVTYEVICERGLAVDKAPLARAFFRYTISSQGQGAAGDLGYAALPEAVRRRVGTAVDRIS